MTPVSHNTQIQHNKTSILPIQNSTTIYATHLVAMSHMNEHDYARICLHLEQPPINTTISADVCHISHHNATAHLHMSEIPLTVGKHTLISTDNTTKKQELREKIRTCNFAPQEGPNILQQLIDLGTPQRTIQSWIQYAREHMPFKGWSLQYQQDMSESLYLTNKGYKTKSVVPKNSLSIIRKSIRHCKITKDQVIPFRKLLLSSGNTPKYVSEIFSICKSKINSSPTINPIQMELLAEINRSNNAIRINNNVSQLNKQLDTKSSQTYAETITDMSSPPVNVERATMIQEEQIQIDPNKYFMDIFTGDIPCLDHNTLIFSQVPVANEQESMLQDITTSSTSIAHSKLDTLQLTKQTRNINLQDIQNGIVDPSILLHSIKTLLNSIPQETLLDALSLYEINHQYDPHSISETLSSATRLIRSHQTQDINILSIQEQNPHSLAELFPEIAEIFTTHCTNYKLSDND